MSTKSKNKEPMIACPSCGAQNRIASPFCKDCGDRIYKHGAYPTLDNTSKEPSSAAKAFRSAVNSLLFLALVAVLALAFWPYAATTIPAGQDPNKQVERYLAVVEEAIDQGKELPVTRISEPNVNAFVGQNNEEQKRKLLGIRLNTPRLELIANEPLGPFNLSTRLLMEPPEGGGAPVPVNFWVGHLPLPPFWAKPWTRSLAARFDLELAPELWEHLRIEKVDYDSVFLKVHP
ncbi:MAG: hypothetical protein ACO3N7_08000 [Kiritimatiellia bacterium]